MEDKRITLYEAANLSYLTPKDITFAKNGEFPMAETSDGAKHDRVWLHRVFPFELSEEFISVQTKDCEEIGIIRRLSNFDDETADLLRSELERKYFIPKIKRILTLRERRGFSYWKVDTDIGEFELSLQDTYRSITKVSSDRIFITDISGNRCEIESLSALDRKSRKKLEIYL